MKATRYILEGTWSGYNAVQRRVVHRQIIRKPVSLSCIEYRDGTTLDIRVRPAKKGERIKEIYGYLGLIQNALAIGKSYVTIEDIRERCY